MDKTDILKLVGTKEGRRLLSIKSPMFFAKYYMGLDYLPHQEKWISEAMRLMDKADRESTKEKLLVLAPRGHGKSYLALILCVWWLVTDRDKTILIVSATASQAEKRLKAVRGYLESKRIIDDWASGDLPPLRDDTTSWLNNRIYIKREGNLIDPSIEAVGIGGSITGGHIDRIILDDVEDSTTANSEAFRRRSTEWLGGTLLPILNRKGLLLTIGTRKGSNDLYGDMLRDATTTAIVDSAIKVFPRSYEFVMENRAGRDTIVDVKIEGEDEAEVLWAEGRPLRYLLTEMASMGREAFFREMQNQPISDDDSVFKPSWVGLALKKGELMSLGEMPEGVTSISVGIDLSLNTDSGHAKRVDSDYSVLIAIGVNKAGDRFLIDMDRFRGLTPDSLYGRIVGFCSRLPIAPSQVRVERNNFGALHAMALKGRTDLPIREHQTTKKSKTEGLSSLAVLLENGKMIIPSATESDKARTRPLVDELVTFPYGKHDDSVLALTIALEAVKESGFHYSVSVGGVEISELGREITDISEYEQKIDEMNRKSIWDSVNPNDFSF